MFGSKDIGKRIEIRRKELNLTLSDISEEIGVATSTIQRYEKGQFTKIKLPIIEAIASALNVNPSWLIGKTDDPTDYEEGDLIAEVPLSYVELFDGDVKKAVQYMRAVDNGRLDIKGNIKLTDVIPVMEMHPVPILGKIRAGYGMTAVENIIGYLPTDHKNYKDCFWLKVVGGSMEPRIFEGDYVLIDKETTIDNGNIVAVIVDGEEGTIKKYEKQENAIVLKPLNPTYETRVFVGKDQSEVYIVGKVVEIKAIV